MTRHPTVRLRVYVMAGVVGLVAALAVGQPEPAIAGVALLVLVLVGLESAAPPGLSVAIDDAPTSIIEGEERSVTLSVTADRPVSNMSLDLALSEGLSVVSADGGRVVDRTTIEVDAAGSATVEVLIRADGWGARTLGPVVARIRPPFGMAEFRQEFDASVRVVSIPSEVTFSELLTPLDTDLHAGDLVSKATGPGMEFAELRPHQHGDDPKHLNWRVSSRLDSLWVNERHPERNGDVLLVLDAQSEVETAIPILIDRGVRLTGALLREYGRRRYRIGLVTIDGVVRWLEPGSGEAHRRRILRGLLTVHQGSSNRHAIERIVMRAAKRPALVIFLTPLLDDSLVGLAHSMRVSGLDMAIVELDPHRYLPEPSTAARALGRRVWKMERERLRDRLATDGIPVAPWTAGAPPDVPLAQLARWRTRWRWPV
ncbi:MAG TPA: DUF58 domain-containing protein [Acidimicrobiia bacterium]|nr:DUF58 domain-containing protein [Acidimicrobiia bacterium]